MAEGYINKDTSFNLSLPITRCTISNWSGKANLIGTNLVIGSASFILETAETNNQYIDAYNGVLTNIIGTLPHRILGQFSVDEISLAGQISCEANANAWFYINGTKSSLSPYIGKKIVIAYQIFYA